MSRQPGTAVAKVAPKAVPALVAASLTAMEKEVGGRAALVSALLHAPKSRDLEYLLGIIGDPARTSVSLAQLCVQGGITPGEILEAYKAGVLARAQVLSTAQIASSLPGVVTDTMRRAMPGETVCEACQGVGMVTAEPSKRNPNPEPATCMACAGKGRHQAEGDLEHKKLALDMGKLLSKGGGLNIAVNQQQNNFVGASAGGTLEKLQAATDQILYGPGDPGPLISVQEPDADPAIDAEVIEVDDVVAGDPPASIDEDWRGEQHG